MNPAVQMVMARIRRKGSGNQRKGTIRKNKKEAFTKKEGVELHHFRNPSFEMGVVSHRLIQYT
jgi:hypothetical protein